MKKKTKIIVVSSLILSMIGFCLFYFVIPTTTYYKVIITPDSMSSMFGGYSSPDIDVYETYSSGNWEETLEAHQTSGSYTKKRQIEEYSDYTPSDRIDGKALALKDISNSRALLVSIKHTRNFDAKDILEDIDDIKRIERKYNLEVRVGYIY